MNWNLTTWFDRLIGRSDHKSSSETWLQSLQFCQQCHQLKHATIGPNLTSGEECRQTCSTLRFSSEKALLRQTGFTKRHVFAMLYPHCGGMSRFGVPKKEEIEALLGLAVPARDSLAEFSSEEKLKTLKACLDAVERGMASIPIICDVRVQLERRRYGKWSRGLWRGEKVAIIQSLKKHLSSNLSSSGFTKCSVTKGTDMVLNDDYSIDVKIYSTQIIPNRAVRRSDGTSELEKYDTVTIYKIWRTNEAFFVCGSSNFYPSSVDGLTDVTMEITNLLS